MSKKKTFEDICPGYVQDKAGINGVCCCGLYWENYMPPHDKQGKPFPYERIMNRTMKQNIQEIEMNKIKYWYQNNGLKHPLHPIARLVHKPNID